MQSCPIMCLSIFALSCVTDSDTIGDTIGDKIGDKITDTIRDKIGNGDLAAALSSLLESSLSI